jgi:hypothetical protein
MVQGGLITALVMGFGLVANLVWLLTNLRIENRIGSKIDALKDWMDQRYVLQEVCDERHGKPHRRPRALDSPA